jgi:hypothetical protein
VPVLRSTLIKFIYNIEKMSQNRSPLQPSGLAAQEYRRVFDTHYCRNTLLLQAWYSYFYSTQHLYPRNFSSGGLKTLSKQELVNEPECLKQHHEMFCILKLEVLCNNLTRSVLCQCIPPHKLTTPEGLQPLYLLQRTINPRQRIGRTILNKHP